MTESARSLAGCDVFTEHWASLQAWEVHTAHCTAAHTVRVGSSQHTHPMDDNLRSIRTETTTSLCRPPRVPSDAHAQLQRVRELGAPPRLLCSRCAASLRRCATRHMSDVQRWERSSAEGGGRCLAPLPRPHTVSEMRATRDGSTSCCSPDSKRTSRSARGARRRWLPSARRTRSSPPSPGRHGGSKRG